MTPEQTSGRVVRELNGVCGVRLASPTGFGTLWHRDHSRLPVELRPGAVRLRLIATRTPLPPLLDKVHEVVRQALLDTPWRDAAITLSVVDIDAVAFE